jgi:hypothetical protein
MQAGSGAQILLAWEDADKLHRALANSKFTAASLAAVRRRGVGRNQSENAKLELHLFRRQFVAQITKL